MILEKYSTEMAKSWRIKPFNRVTRPGVRNGITGVYEIRTSDDGKIYRAAYVAKFDNNIVILHCWNKITQTTAESDKKLIVKRYREFQEYM